MNEITDKEIDRFYGEYERPSRNNDIPEWCKIKRRKSFMEPKKDCFAYRRARCNILTEMVCKHTKCSFYKTTACYNADRKKYGFDRNYKEKEKEGEANEKLCSDTQ